MQENIQTVLLEMASLLRTYYDTGWGDVYDKLAKCIVVAPTILHEEYSPATEEWGP